MDQERTESPGATGWVRVIRDQLGMTQAGLAAALGVSAKAVQSYEQGWRRLPKPIFAHLVALLALHRDGEGRRLTCWELTGCPADVRVACPSGRLGEGRFCWFVSGSACRRPERRRGAGPVGCETCVVVSRLVAGTVTPSKERATARRAAGKEQIT